MGIKRVVDGISEEAIDGIADYINNKYKNKKCEIAWKNSIKCACNITEEIEENFGRHILSCNSVKRHYILLNDKKNFDNIYYSFIISIAVEMCAYNKEYYAISFAMAILDNWFELNEIETNDLKKNLKLDCLEEIISDREKIYRSYLELYNDKYARDIIRVYYPRNNESWIEWDKDCSIDIRVNLSKGIDYGFCRIGFSYSRIREGYKENFLKLAYVHNDKEIFRFEHDLLLKVGVKEILWAM